MPAPAGFAAPPASPTTVVQNDFFALIPFKPARRKARAYAYALRLRFPAQHSHSSR